MDTSGLPPPRPRAFPDPVSPARPGTLRRAHSAGGFTLVEVILASVVMLFAISSSIMVMQSGFRSLDNARKTTLASQIMQSEMERIRMLSWGGDNGISTLVGTEQDINLRSIFPQTTDTERTILEQMERTFTTRRRSVTTLGAYDDQIAEITITIAWRGIDGVPHTRSSTTRYTQEGLYSYYVTGITSGG